MNRLYAIVRSVTVPVALGACTAGALAQPDPAQVQRLRGVIDHDQTWSGLILITDDLAIQDGTVTVQPGTLIEFAQRLPGSHPTLTVGSAAGTGGRLQPMGTAEKPIIFRTRPGSSLGRIVVHVHSRIISTDPATADLANVSQPRRVPDDVAWQHVYFENLGYDEEPRPKATAPRMAVPAVTFHVVGAAHSLGVVNCVFDHASSLRVRAADGATITLMANRFTNPTGRVCIEVFGHEGLAPAESVVLRRNVLAAAIDVQATAAAVTENVLIGPNAAIVIRNEAAGETQVVGNYVHNTTKADDGHYCLNCENPNALIADNVLRGGTTCVLQGSRRMSGNVLIAAPRLASQYVRNAHTHQLVYALPAGAVFERNLLIGPAHSMLLPQPSQTSRAQSDAGGLTVIRHNILDGFSHDPRAIHLNPLGRPPITISVFNNLFLRVSTLVYDEGRTSTTLVYADYNAVAPSASRPFDQARIAGLRLGAPGWAGHDVSCNDPSALRLTARLPDRVPDFDADLLARRLTVHQIRTRLFNLYRPQTTSPLVGAGRRWATYDPAAPRPTIGPTDPIDKPQKPER